MPYKSKAQAAFFHANKEKLEKQGVDVSEWDAASKGKSLPERVAPKKKKPQINHNLREADIRRKLK